jgi:hypothetical protein
MIRGFLHDIRRLEEMAVHAIGDAIIDPAPRFALVVRLEIPQIAPVSRQ